MGQLPEWLKKFNRAHWFILPAWAVIGIILMFIRFIIGVEVCVSVVVYWLIMFMIQNRIMSKPEKDEFPK